MVYVCCRGLFGCTSWSDGHSYKEQSNNPACNEFIVALGTLYARLVVGVGVVHFGCVGGWVLGTGGNVC